ncbi:MAG: ABC transporter permease [Candidatus Cyclobacteriaceae bacterium M2_1C_046]
MNKILLIIKREYLSRVQKKSFLIATLLVPLIFPLIIGGMAYVAVQEKLNAEIKVVQVVDESGLLNFEETSRFNFVKVDLDLEQAKTAFSETGDFGLLYVPELNVDDPAGVTFYSRENPSITVISDIEKEVERSLEEIKLKRSGITKETLDSLKSNISIASINVTETGEEKISSAGWASGIGYATGMLIYIFLFVYGAQVMQGVIEEKNNKIVEIIVSTVRPFQLMLGKVLGVAAVGLTQILIWLVLITILSSITLTYFGFDASGADMASGVMQNLPEAQASTSLGQDPDFQQVIAQWNAIPFGYIAFCFIVYFVGGFLLYGALFAAVGSAVENQSDAQQFMFPIMLPIIIGFMGLFMFVLDDPHGGPSFWLSIIPFTSPIVMMGRIGFEVPVWELILSMILLIGGFVFTIWLAGRIYRIGILMHGTKVSYKTLGKWLMARN